MLLWNFWTSSCSYLFELPPPDHWPQAGKSNKYWLPTTCTGGDRATSEETVMKSKDSDVRTVSDWGHGPESDGGVMLQEIVTYELGVDGGCHSNSSSSSSSMITTCLWAPTCSSIQSCQPWSRHKDSQRTEIPQAPAVMTQRHRCISQLSGRQ